MNSVSAELKELRARVNELEFKVEELKKAEEDAYQDGYQDGYDQGERDTLAWEKQP